MNLSCSLWSATSCFAFRIELQQSYHGTYTAGLLSQQKQSANTTPVPSWQAIQLIFLFNICSVFCLHKTNKDVLFHPLITNVTSQSINSCFTFSLSLQMSLHSACTPASSSPSHYKCPFTVHAHLLHLLPLSTNVPSQCMHTCFNFSLSVQMSLHSAHTPASTSPSQYKCPFTVQVHLLHLLQVQMSLHSACTPASSSKKKIYPVKRYQEYVSMLMQCKILTLIHAHPGGQSYCQH